MSKPVEIFFSYAHEDEPLMDEVRRQLVIFDRQRIISKWHDRKISPGAELSKVIDTRIRQAQIILLFVSPHFLESRYCWDIEMAEAMKRHNAGSAQVIPVILRHCLWQSAPFAGLLALPKDGKPISAWSDKDEACMNVAAGIMQVVAEIKINKGKNKPKIKPFKLLILDNKEIFPTTVSGESVEWNRFIQAVITNPYFPNQLRQKLEGKLTTDFILLDLEKKEIMSPPPATTLDFDTEFVALLHKDVMADLPPEIMAEILIRKYSR